MARIERKRDLYRDHHQTSRDEELVFVGPERIPLFKRLVGGPGRRVLDLGCRYGALTRHYLGGNEVVGLDVDRDALERAAELGIEPVWGDVEEPLDFDDESFDVVVCGELLEHVRSPDALVAESDRVLMRGGTFVASTPNGFRLKNRLSFLVGRQPEKDPTHLHLFAPGDIQRLLSRFADTEVHFIAGRLARLHPRLMANDIVFAGRKR